ncbi:type II secretion system protein N [Pusillimonas sp.]|uniref:type II secretion system protein N n=1 Tax=Pusillimonas sp. TaxID=3040095 RepID=UPI0037C7C8C8
MFPRVISLSASLGARGPFLLQAAAMVALAAGIGLWSALLLAPRPAPAPPALASGPAPGQDLTPVSNWFGGGSARLRVAVVGLIASGQQGAALLSINGGPAQAYRVGQTLAQGVTLSAVLPNGVSIDQDGIVEDITMPSQPMPPQGFVPVDPAGLTAS